MNPTALVRDSFAAFVTIAGKDVRVEINPMKYFDRDPVLAAACWCVTQCKDPASSNVEKTTTIVPVSIGKVKTAVNLPMLTNNSQLDVSTVLRMYVPSSGDEHSASASLAPAKRTADGTPRAKAKAKAEGKDKKDKKDKNDKKDKKDAKKTKKG